MTSQENWILLRNGQNDGRMDIEEKLRGCETSRLKTKKNEEVKLNGLRKFTVNLEECTCYAA